MAEGVRGRSVRLTRGRWTQDRIDRFGRLLAYVDRPGIDVGLELIRAGHAAVFLFARPFQRLRSYQQAEDAARGGSRGVWGSCGGNFDTPAESGDETAPSREASAERFIRRYYLVINQRRFSTEWAKFSAGLRQQLGPYAKWRSGFRRTLGTRVNSVSVSLAGGRAVVRVAIRARDRDACSGRVVRQFFRVRWVLARGGESWVATSATARKVGGGIVRLERSACSPRPSRPSPQPPPSGGGGRGCHPSYRPCVPNDRDYDCGELPDSDYHVVGRDEYRLDADHDGIGCES